MSDYLVDGARLGSLEIQTKGGKPHGANMSKEHREIVVLSHDKPFLFRVWDGADLSMHSAVEVARDVQGSTLRPWDITAGMVTEHDRRHAAMLEYVRNSIGSPRDVAENLRPILETSPDSYPDAFEPGALMGPS